MTGRGIGSIAVSAMLDAIAVRTCKRDYRILIDSENYASQSLFEKLGAKPNGISSFLLKSEDDKRAFEEENLSKIDDRMIAKTTVFNVEPRKLLSHVLENKLHWE